MDNDRAAKAVKAAMAREAGYHTMSSDDEAGSFAKLLKKKWRNVKYNAKTGQGTADIGGAKVEFSQSSNEDMVRIEKVTTSFFKADPDLALKIVQEISNAVNKA